MRKPAIILAHAHCQTRTRTKYFLLLRFPGRTFRMLVPSVRCLHHICSSRYQHVACTNYQP